MLTFTMQNRCGITDGKATGSKGLDMKNPSAQARLPGSVVGICCVLFIVGCASSSAKTASPTKNDPLEGFNRAVFRFNDGLDRILVKPVARAYRYIAPDFVETGVSNFFNNIREVPSLLNAGLQGKGKKSVAYTGRFLVNSTLGVLGLVDVAERMGMEKMDEEDFGQTLANWGVASGAYLVLPLLGPSTIRDGAAFPVNQAVNPVGYVDHDRTRNAITASGIIDTRAGLLDSENLITGDRYLFVRDVWLQRRKFLIQDGKIEDSFGGSLKDEDF